MVLSYKLRALVRVLRERGLEGFFRAEESDILIYNCYYIVGEYEFGIETAEEITFGKFAEVDLTLHDFRKYSESSSDPLRLSRTVLDRYCTSKYQYYKTPEDLVDDIQWLLNHIESQSKMKDAAVQT